MAKFRLSLLNLTETNSNRIQFTQSVISEFYSPEAVVRHEPSNIFEEQYNNYCYTYNESLSIHSNAQKELTFDLEKLILKDDQWMENPYSRMMLPGVQLCLEDMFDNQYLFTITSVKYDFKETNIIYHISCQDSFSQQLSTQNDGYEIVNDSSRSDFIGAKTIDFWANKIVDECHIPYLYVALNQPLYRVKHSNGMEELSIYKQPDDIIIKTYKQDYPQSTYPEYYDLIPFAASGNANSVLIELGNKIDFMINTCEFATGNSKFQRYFWLEPKKHENTSGLIYSPFNSIKSFNLTHNGKSLTTIMNVVGSSENNKVISLLPSIPPYFLQLFNSQEWSTLHYVPGIYSSIIYHQLQEYNNLNPEGLRIWHKRWNEEYIDTYIDVTPTELTEQNLTASNGLQPIAYYLSNNYYFPIATNEKGTFYIPGYDSYEFQYEKNISTISYEYDDGGTKVKDSWDSVHYNFTLCYIELPTNSFVPTITEINNTNMSDYKYIELPSDECHQLFLCIKEGHSQIASTFTILSENIYLNWTRIPTEEEIEFAKIADEIPWLENKLINFSYFYDHNIINKKQYSELQEALLNELRDVNGKLIFYTNAYYNALHTQTTEMANLTNSLESLGATFKANVLLAYQNNNKVTSIQQFISAYNSVFTVTALNTKKEILNYDNIYADYVNKYFAAQQRFLKNIELFQQYFNENISFFKPNACVYKDSFSITSNAPATYDYIYAFKQNDNQMSLVNNSFYFADENGTPLTDIYEKNNGTYSPIQVVDAQNYTKFRYARIEADNNFTVISSGNTYYDKDKQYCCKAWPVRSNATLLQTYGIEHDWTQTNSANYRRWHFIVVGDTYYVYPINPMTSDNGKYTTSTNALSLSYEITDKGITSRSTILAYGDPIWIPWTTTDMQKAYKELRRLKLSGNNYFYGCSSETIGDLDLCYIRANELYTPATDLFFYKNFSECQGSTDKWKWYSPIWSYSSNEYKFINPWYYTCYYNCGSLSVAKNVCKNKSPELYIKNLPLDTLYIYTHQYKCKNSQWYVVNEKGEIFSEWYKRMYNTAYDPYYTSRLGVAGDPYSYFVYQEVPFITNKNYTTFMQSNFPEHSWMYKLSMAGAIGQACLGFPFSLFGKLLTSQTTSLDGFFDNINYKNWHPCDVTYDHPGQLVYGTRITEPYLVQSTSADISETTQDWVQKATELLTTKGSGNTSSLSIDDLDNWWLITDKVSSSTTKYKKLPTASYISYFKYCYHTFGTLLDTIRRSEYKYSNVDYNHYNTTKMFSHTAFSDSDVYPTEPFYIKDSQCSILNHTDPINPSDKFYFLPLTHYYASASNRPDYEIFINWSGFGMNIDSLSDANYAEFLFNVSLFRDSHGSDRYWKDNHHYISKTACYPWFNVAEQLVPTEKETTVEQMMTRLHSDWGHRSITYTAETPYGNKNFIYTIFTYGSMTGIIVRVEDFDRTNITLNNYTDLQKYYLKSTDRKISWDHVKYFTYGAYIHNNKDDDIVPATELPSFDDNKHYYDNENKRYYTLKQIKNAYQYYYMQTTSTYEYNWSDEKLQFTNIPVYEYKVERGANNSISKLIYSQTLNVTLNVPTVLDKTNGYTVVVPNTNAPLRIKVLGVKEADLQNISNGQFWWTYHSDIEKSLLFEYAAAIETKLQEYWSIAYNASLFCEYIIPDSWQPVQEDLTQGFSNLLYNFDRSKDNNNNIVTNLTLSNFLPTVTKLSNEKGEFTLPAYKFAYSSVYTQQYQPIQPILDSNVAIASLTKIFGKDFWDNFSAEEIGTCNYYVGEGGTLKTDILFSLNKDTAFTYFGGLYEMIIKYLKQCYINKPLTEYYTYTQKHNEIWRRLYQTYPSILVENKYTNTDATSSWDLLTMAKYAFKDLSYPEREYSISMINNAKDFLNYQGQELHIGDPIQLASKEFYNQFDDIRISLDQLLFITDLKYNLREDNNISITVNSIKYQDKLIQRLIKLIK